MNRNQIFISYVRDDEKEAQLLYQSLVKRNLNVFLDTERIKPGYVWKDTINKELENSKFFILINTKNLLDRDKNSYVHEEIRLALNLNKHCDNVSNCKETNKNPKDCFDKCEKKTNKLKILPARFDQSELYNEEIQRFQYFSMDTNEGLRALFREVKPLKKIRFLLLVSLSVATLIFFLKSIYMNMDFLRCLISFCEKINCDIFILIGLFFFLIIFDKINKNGFKISIDFVSLKNVCILFILTGFFFIIYEISKDCKSIWTLSLLTYLIVYPCSLKILQSINEELDRERELLMYCASFLLGAGFFVNTMLFMLLTQ